jgi:hypothetical protein
MSKRDSILLEAAIAHLANVPLRQLLTVGGLLSLYAAMKMADAK